MQQQLLENIRRQGRDVGHQQIAAAELGLDQMLRIRAANRDDFLAQPIDYDIDRAVANGVLGTIKQFPDFIACTEGPGLR